MTTNHDANESKIEYKTGLEGSVHDPYGYEELTITRGDSRIAAHVGLISWVAKQHRSWNGGWIGNYNICESYEEFDKVFERMAGDTFDRIVEGYILDHQEELRDQTGCLADYE